MHQVGGKGTIYSLSGTCTIPGTVQGQQQLHCHNNNCHSLQQANGGGYKRQGASAGGSTGGGEVASNVAMLPPSALLVTFKVIPAFASAGIVIVKERPSGVCAFICMPGNAP